MKQYEGFLFPEQEEQVYKLIKFLYGLKHTPKKLALTNLMISLQNMVYVYSKFLNKVLLFVYK